MFSFMVHNSIICRHIVTHRVLHLASGRLVHIACLVSGCVQRQSPGDGSRRYDWVTAPQSCPLVALFFLCAGVAQPPMEEELPLDIPFA